MSNKSVLHAFSDSSLKAYGSVVFTVTDGKVDLVITKARVTPIKSPTLPQLELIAANLSAKLVNYVVNACPALNNVKIYCWTDSQIVLHWTNSQKSPKSYVQCRVDDIKTRAPTADWRYVYSECNPADYLSRSMTAKAFLKSDLWFFSPSWLTDVNNWPKIVCNVSEVEEHNYSEHVNVCELNVISSENVIDIKRFSSYSKLLNVTALVFYFIRTLKNKVKQLNSNDSPRHISLDDVKNAELYWLKVIQKECYSDVLEYFINQKNRKPTLVKQLQLRLNTDLITWGGRFSESDWDSCVKHPILLPSNHPITNLNIGDCHQRCKHGGVNMTVAEIRQQWWIPRCRQRVKSLLRRCVTCLKVTGKPYIQPPTAPLPDFRLQEARPFEVVGLDYTGALFVKSGKRDRD